ncbi:MAG: PDZ domain-containing protein [Leadbetterella sp.]|nr:PDZ domain-containing protein [Leadbetterella sp.]
MSGASKTIALLLGLTFWFFQSCNRKGVVPEPEPEKPISTDTTKTPVKPRYFDENTWIYQQMTINYLWADNMPDEDSTNKALEPLDYFNSLLNKEKDRYSYAKNTYGEIADYWNGQLESYGFRYKRLTDSSGYKMAVSLVLKGSPAEEAGLKRGDIITRMDGDAPTAGNTTALLERKSAAFTVLTPEDSVKTLTITKRKFQVDPLQMAKIIEWQGKKVGYLVYTQFLFNYEPETRKIFQYFKDNKIDEMVLDLRFNPGGVTPNAEVMASLLAPDLGNTVELFHGLTNSYLAKQAQQNGTASENGRYFTNETSNLSKLSRLFVITSKSSASSSELVINCLRPYRPVFTVGGNTYGKNVISIVLADETGKYPFTIMPAWMSILNVNNESTYGNKDGIPANYPVEEDILPYRPLGDPSETLLGAALKAISGPAPESKARKARKVTVLDGFHHFDTGTGFLGDKRYNP